MKLYTLVYDKERHPQLKCMIDDNELEWHLGDNKTAVEYIIHLLSLHRQVNETNIVVALSETNEPLGYYLHTIGDNGHCTYDPRTMWMFLFLIGANKFIDIHNHPDRDFAQPSENDLYNFKDNEECGNMLGIDFAGGVVVAGSTWAITLNGETETYYYEDFHDNDESDD